MPLLTVIKKGKYMKVGRNSTCPCGSGKKYKHCCLNDAKNVKLTNILGHPMELVKDRGGFIVNNRGAVIFKDESLQPYFDVPEGDTYKYVFNVGISPSGKPVATILEGNDVIYYMLPDWYIGWCRYCFNAAMIGYNLFPANVMFSKTNGRYSADII